MLDQKLNRILLFSFSFLGSSLFLPVAAPSCPFTRFLLFVSMVFTSAAVCFNVLKIYFDNKVNQSIEDVEKI